MKNTVIYEVALTGSGQNFYTLYRHAFGPEIGYHSKFVQNLSIDFDEAVAKARAISGEDENTETREKKLVTNPDEVNEIKRLGSTKALAEANGIFAGGKHKGEKIEDVFVSDKKYVEWVAKGGFYKPTDPRSGKVSDYWFESIEMDRAIRQHAIALLIGAGDWIERNGVFMPVERAQKLDYLESLTPDPTIEDKQRVTRHVKLLGNIYHGQGNYGSTMSFKLVDENEHVYSVNTSGFSFYPQPDEWNLISFTSNLYNGKVYCKRIKVLGQAIEILEGMRRIENELFNKKQYVSAKFTDKDQIKLDKITVALNRHESLVKIAQV